MSISLKINQNELMFGMQREIERVLTDAFKKASVDIKRQLSALTRSLIENSPEYHSLMSGILKDEFGLKDPSIPLGEIVSVLQKGIIVNTLPAKFVSNTISGGISINMIRSDFNELLNLSGTKFSYKGMEIEWLNWLLTYGDSIIILKHDFSVGGSGIEALAGGGGFRVPPQFSGVINDNWITRTFNLQALESLVRNIIKTSIEGRL